MCRSWNNAFCLTVYGFMAGFAVGFGVCLAVCEGAGTDVTVGSLDTGPEPSTGNPAFCHAIKPPNKAAAF